MQLAECQRARLCEAAAIVGDEHSPVRGWRYGLCGMRGVAVRVDERDGAGGQFANEGDIAFVFIPVGNGPVHVCWSGCASDCYGRMRSFLSRAYTARCIESTSEGDAMQSPHPRRAQLQCAQCRYWVALFHEFSRSCESHEGVHDPLTSLQWFIGSTA